MELSVSNIAWDTALDGAVAELLKAEGVHCIDIAPGKYFQNFATVTEEEITQVKEFWSSFGIQIVGMQSLLFGTKGLNLFAKETQQAMLAHLKAVRRIAVNLGVERLTFGSPKNRDRTGLTDRETEVIASEFFSHWKSLGEEGDCVTPRLLLEPNPEIYGANFLTTTESAAQFVRILSDPTVAMQLDLGTVTANKEGATVIGCVKDVIGHIHVSEPFLVPVGSIDSPHAQYAKGLESVMAKYLTIEMVQKDSSLQLESLKNSIQFVKRVYCKVLL